MQWQMYIQCELGYQPEAISSESAEGTAWSLLAVKCEGEETG